MSNEFTKEHTKIAKGFAIIFMVALHLFAHDEWLEGTNNTYITMINIKNLSIDVLLSSFGKVCVAMYLFLSGYGLYKTYLSRKEFTIRDSLIRIKNLYLNYLLILIIFIPIGYILGVYKENATISRLLVNFLCLDFYYNSFAWFIRLYFILVLLFPILVKILDKNIIKNIVIVLCLAVGNIILNKIQYNLNYKDIIIVGNIGLLNELNTIILWSIHFIIGISCARFKLYEIIKEKLSQFHLNNNIFYLICFLICVVLRIKLPYKEILDSIYAPITIVALTNIVFNNKLKKIFIYLGEHSTNIWLIHFYFTYKYFQNIIYYPKYTVLILIWSFIVMTPISILLNKILNLIKEKINNRKVAI